jgi:hypothetical protein
VIRPARHDSAATLTRALTIALASALACTATACGERGDDGPTGSARSAVIGGASDVDHAAVVSILTTAEASVSELCSGVLVAPRLVLTAGHCLVNQTADGLQIGVGPSAAAPLATVAAVALVVAPGWVDDLPTNQRTGHDLGAIVLASDAPIAPVVMADASPIAAGDAGSEASPALSVVGFGVSDPTDAESAGARLLGATTLGGDDPSCGALIPFGSTGARACHGDSGGALFAFAPDGSERLVGIVSWGRDDACDPPSYATAIAPWRTWIDALARGDVDAGCTACPVVDAGGCDGASTRATGAAGDAAVVTSNDTGGDSTDAAQATSGAPRAGGCAVGSAPFARPRASDEPLAAALVVLAACGEAIARARRRRRTGPGVAR